jgi:hypothetical protein
MLCSFCLISILLRLYFVKIGQFMKITRLCVRSHFCTFIHLSTPIIYKCPMVRIVKINFIPS